MEPVFQKTRQCNSLLFTTDCGMGKILIRFIVSGDSKLFGIIGWCRLMCVLKHTDGETVLFSLFLMILCLLITTSISVCLSVSDGIRSMASRNVCCQAIAGSGATSRVCTTNLWTVSDLPLTAGSGRATGTWMKTLRESPQTKG